MTSPNRFVNPSVKRNKVGQRTQKQDGTQQAFFKCMLEKALYSSAHAPTLKQCMSHRPTFENHQFFRTIALLDILSGKTCQQQECSCRLAPCQRSYACPIAQRLLRAQFFGTVILMEFVLKTRPNSSAFSVYRSLPRKLSPLFPTISFPFTLSSRLAPLAAKSAHTALAVKACLLGGKQLH